MKLVFVHGWSVTSLNVYGELPQALAKLAPQALGLDVHHIHLGRYISFNDAVTIEDIAHAFEAARQAELGESQFAVIAHSTGGPVIRTWLDMFYGAAALNQTPLSHLIMLAPANHGSALAQLGKSRLGRLTAWFDNVEPGQQILDWLELGSDGQHHLNRQWLDYNLVGSRFYPFVLTGDTIDKSLYDYVNSYTAEAGTDGVVRVSSANMNFQHLVLRQNDTAHFLSFDEQPAASLDLLSIKHAPKSAFCIVPKAAHSKTTFGIMNSVTVRNARYKPVVEQIFACLTVESDEQYQALAEQMSIQTAVQQKRDKYAQLVIRVTDNCGHKVNEFDFYLLCGNDYLPGILPKGFMLDKQKNRANGNSLTLYLNASKLAKVPDAKLGFKIVARPDQGFSRYSNAEFRSDTLSVGELLIANQTLMLDIVLTRHIAKNSFSFATMTDEPNFKNLKASHDFIDVEH